MPSDTSAYVALLRGTARNSVLDPGLAGSLAALGGRHDRSIVAELAARAGLDDDTAAALGADRSLDVRVTWLTNLSISDEQFAAALDDEDRSIVYVMAASRLGDFIDDIDSVELCDIDGHRLDSCELRDVIDRRIEQLLAAAPLDALLELVAEHFFAARRHVAMRACSAASAAAPLDTELLNRVRNRLSGPSALRADAIATVNHPELVAVVAATARPGELDERFDELLSALLAGVDDPHCATLRIFDGATVLIAHSADPHRYLSEVVAAAERGADDDMRPHVIDAATLAADVASAAASDRSSDHAKVVGLICESNSQRRYLLSNAVDPIVRTLLANPALSDDDLRDLVIGSKIAWRTLHGALAETVMSRRWDVDDAVQLAVQLERGEVCVHSTDPVEACARYCETVESPLSHLEALEALSVTHPGDAADLAAEHVGLVSFQHHSAPRLSALCSERLLAALADPSVATLCAEAFDEFDGTLAELLAALSSAYATT